MPFAALGSLGLGDAYFDCVSGGNCTAATVLQSNYLGLRFGGPLNLPSSPAPSGKLWIVTPAGNALVDQATFTKAFPWFPSGFAYISDLNAVMGNSSMLTAWTTGFPNGDIQNGGALETVGQQQQAAQKALIAANPPETAPTGSSSSTNGIAQSITPPASGNPTVPASTSPSFFSQTFSLFGFDVPVWGLGLAAVAGLFFLGGHK